MSNWMKITVIDGDTGARIDKIVLNEDDAKIEMANMKTKMNAACSGVNIFMTEDPEQLITFVEEFHEIQQ